MSPKEFQQFAARARRLLQEPAPAIVGIEATKHFKASFQNEGFTDQSLEKWPDISEKRKRQKTKRNGSRAKILTDTGDLSNSLTWTHEGDNVIVSSDLPYAQRHNEGLSNMPKRQFMGPSQQLDNKIINKLERELKRLLNQ